MNLLYKHRTRIILEYDEAPSRNENHLKMPWELFFPRSYLCINLLGISVVYTLPPRLTILAAFLDLQCRKFQRVWGNDRLAIVWKNIARWLGSIPWKALCGTRYGSPWVSSSTTNKKRLEWSASSSRSCAIRKSRRRHGRNASRCPLFKWAMA